MHFRHGGSKRDTIKLRKDIVSTSISAQEHGKVMMENYWNICNQTGAKTQYLILSDVTNTLLA